MLFKNPDGVKLECIVDPRNPQTSYIWTSSLDALIKICWLFKSSFHFLLRKASESAQPFNVVFCRISRWEQGLSLTLKQKPLLTGMKCVSILQMFPQTPLFSLDGGTLTHSVFTAAGGLSAVFTHITGVKSGRFYNEAPRMRTSDAIRMHTVSHSAPRGTRAVTGAAILILFL